VGCHLMLVGTPGLPATVGQLLQALLTRRINVYAELVRQVRRILEAGIQPSHLDTHKHTHLLPPVLDALARISEALGIRRVRRPFDFPLSTNGAGFAKKTVSRS